jgi:phosphatidylserine decarboxylase
LIAREGWLFIFLALSATGLAGHFLGILAALPFAIAVIVLFFLFRDPPRKIPSAPLGLVSPVDGTIVEITQVHDKYLDRQAICLRLKMNWYGIYSTRSPTEGKVIKHWFGDDGKAAQWIQTDEGDDVVVSLIKGRGSRQPACMVPTGERIGQGRRCGFVRFGALVELLVPVNTRIDKQAGDKVLAGTDIVATLVHKAQ